MLSVEDIQTIANRTFENESVEVIDYKFHAHSEDKVGFLGDHQNLDIKVKRASSNAPETRRYFVKAMPQKSAKQSKFIKDGGLFKQEATFFDSLLPCMMQYYKGEEFCPKYMFATDKIIVLEDMRTRGFAMYDKKIFDDVHLQSAVRAQARLHAASVLTEAQLGKPLNELFPLACKEQVFTEKMVIHRRLNVQSDLARQIGKRQVGRDDRRIFTALKRGFTRIYRPEGKSKLNRVICHGDTWPNNYLFDSSSPPKCVMVDFQLVRYGPRMYDVAQLIYLSTTNEIKKEQERATIEAYYEEFCDVLGKNNPELERPTLDEILEEYESVRLTAIFASTMYYPIICMSKEELAKYEDKQEELYGKLIFRDNNDFVMDVYERDPEYAGRFNDLIRELMDIIEKRNIPEREINGVVSK